MPFKRIFNNVPDIDFSSLYPTTTRDYSGLYKKIKLKKDRLEKLNRLNAYNE